MPTWPPSRAIDTIAGVRQFEISGRTPAPLGRSNNYPRSVARRIGAGPARAVLEVIGGQGPQHLVTEFAGAIAAGAAEVVMVMGSENTSSLRHFAGRDDKPDHAETIDGQLEDRGYGYDGIFDEYTIRHGLIGAPVQYGLLENARRARLGLSVADYRTVMAELFAPFSKVAAKNPFSSAPVERSVPELATITASNRMICDPYPRMMVARDQVNQGAAAVLMSVAAARRFGVPEEKWVYLRGHADMKEQKLLERADIGASPASVTAVDEARRVAGIASKYSVGIYSTAPGDWVADNSAALLEDVAVLPKVAITEQADGAAVVETYTVRYDWPVRTGIIIGRMQSDGSRFLATSTDEELVGLMADGDPLGASITVSSGEKGNRATLA